MSLLVCVAVAAGQLTLSTAMYPPARHMLGDARREIARLRAYRLC